MPFHRFWKASRTFVTVCMTAQLLAGCVTVGGTDVSDRVAIDALANGIALRPADGSLFVTDDKTHSVLVSHDRQVFTSYAALPAGDGPSEALSQVTVMRDTGTPVVARFGFGTSGAVFGMPRAGTVVPWSGLAPDRRRLGLVDIGAQRVLSTWFVKHAGEPATGGLSMLTYDESLGAAVERDLVTGFDKPVGVAVSGDRVVVSDQSANRLVSTSLQALLAAPRPVDAATLTVLAPVNGPDLIDIDDHGTVYTKCNGHDVCAIAANGSSEVLAHDLINARGIAVDAARHRLYVIDRGAAGPAASYLRLIPIP